MAFGGYDDDDNGFTEAVEEYLKGLQEGPVLDYLARNGDAIEQRVGECINRAEQLLAGGFPGAALASALTAIELTIRFFLVRPLLHGAFMSDEWADILVERIVASGARGPTVDRELLPAILRNWRIDITALRTESGALVWHELQRPGGLVDLRNKYVHQGEDVHPSVADLAVHCSTRLLRGVVDPLAERLGFTRAETGVWSIIKRKPPGDLGPEEQRVYLEFNRPIEYERSNPFG